MRWPARALNVVAAAVVVVSLAGVAPTSWADAPGARTERAADDAATPAARRLLGEVAAIERNARSTRYQAVTRVDVDSGRYAFDCSGMLNWLLQRSARTAWRALGRSRPVARDYAATIERAPLAAPARERRGWQRVARMEDARPGDIIAWRTPRRWGPATGHVVVLLERPRRPALGSMWLARIADSTSFPHANDSTSWARDGFGTGVMSFANDGSAWSWLPPWSPTVDAPIAIGRITR